ncbi:MAG: DUF5777 family beta-barrel protein [Saprospiraceae bacterium]
MKKHYFLFLFFFLGVVMVHAQDDDLLSLIEEEPVTDYATASFKTNRVVNLHSLENTAKGVFDFKISHRFNTIDQGFYDWFGLDGADALELVVILELLINYKLNRKEYH